MNLYELTESYQQIQTLIEEGAEGLEDTLQSLDDAIEEKAVGYAKVMKNIEGQVVAIKTEEKRLADKRRSLENNVKRLKESLQDAMLFNNKKSIKTDLFNFNIQKNPPSIRVIDEKMIPKRFYEKQEPKLNRRGLLDELKSDESIPGVEIHQGESLRIR